MAAKIYYIIFTAILKIVILKFNGYRRCSYKSIAADDDDDGVIYCVYSGFDAFSIKAESMYSSIFR